MSPLEKQFVSYKKDVILGAFTTEELLDEIMARDKDALILLVFKLAKEYDELKKEYEEQYVPPTARKNMKIIK